MTVDVTGPVAGCPQCKSGSGQPYRSVREDQQEVVRVLLRCDGCRHRWSILVPSPSRSGESQA